MNELKETILQKIQEGKVHMEPRWHFVLKTLLFGVGTIVVGLASLYVLSFLFFTLHRSGLMFAPGLGLRGVGFFLVSSPWLLMALLAVFLVTLYLLVKHYAFSYRRPLVYSIVAITAFAVGGASVLHAMGVHERIEAVTEQYQVPGFAPLYRMAQEYPEGVTLGVVTTHTDSGFMMDAEDEEGLNVLVHEGTRMPRRMDQYDIGDVVLVFGDRAGGTITAFGVRPVSGDPAFERHGMRGGKRGERGWMMSSPGTLRSE